MAEVRGVSQEEYKVISDLTQKVIDETQTFFDFPSDLEILNAQLILMPDGWGGVVRYLYIEYQFDGVEYEMMRPMHANAYSIIIDMIFDIVDHYRRTHP